MNPLTAIIPSKNASNLGPCADAVWASEPGAKVLVVWDGDLNAWPFPCKPWGFTSGGVAQIILGIKPFCFSRNCNIGIKAAATNDVILLNDDALLQTPGGFTLMQKAAEEHPEFGIISATTNVAGNPSQRPQGVGLREESRVVAFVCVFIPRRTIDAVGLMDERFGGFMPPPDGRRIYGWCDNDYCRRVREAGLKIGIHDGCFVDHGSLTSSFRGDPRAPGDISAGGELYQAKWGDRN